jgi:hypothetical protein
LRRLIRKYLRIIFRNGSVEFVLIVAHINCCSSFVISHRSFVKTQDNRTQVSRLKSSFFYYSILQSFSFFHSRIHAFKHYSIVAFTHSFQSSPSHPPPVFLFHYQATD